MRAKVFFAENDDGVKLSFTRLSLKKALENINKKNRDNEFTIIDYIIVKKPKVVRDIIAKSILDKKIENTDLYTISDEEIKDIIEYAIEFFNANMAKNLYEDYDSDNKEFEEYDSQNDPEYIPLNDEVISEEDDDDDDDDDDDNDAHEEDEENEEDEVLKEQEESNKPVFIDEKGSIIEQSLNIFNSIYYSVKDILIIYGVSFILYNIYLFFLEKRTTKSVE